VSDTDDKIRQLDRTLDEIARTSETNRFTEADYSRLEQALGQDHPETQQT